MGLFFVVCLVGCAIALFYAVYPDKYKAEITEYSQKYNLNPALVASVINAESGYNKNALSSKGAMGLMQLLPSTAAEISFKLNRSQFSTEMLLDEKINIEFGCYYLSYLIKEFGSTRNALAAYNAGLGRVKTWLSTAEYAESGELKKIPFTETEKYIEKIERNLKIYEKRFS